MVGCIQMMGSMGDSPPEPFIIRRRKRKCEDDDNVSIQSLDTGMINKKKSRRRSIIRVSSLASIFSPGKTAAAAAEKKSNNEGLKKQSSTASFKLPATPVRQSTPYKSPQPKPAKRRLSRTWSDMMIDGGRGVPSLFSNMDIKRQEAIYELYQGELDLIEDLNVVQKTYLESMRKLRLLTEYEIDQIFSNIRELVPIHERLVNKLQNQRLPDGTTFEVGRTIASWVSQLRPYVMFCANQVFSKAMLDEKKNNDADMDDFLTRCMESPFSRKLDLWGLLDGARGRFMKYPLLIRSIQKYTPKGHEDIEILNEASADVEKLIHLADEGTGWAKCRYFRLLFIYLFDEQRHPAIEESEMLMCSGALKNNKGSKLHLFLFDKILVITRMTHQNGRSHYQLYRQPIPLEDLVLEDLVDGTNGKMGSFRSTFRQAPTGKNLFRVSFRNPSDGQSHTLLANDEHNKRQWLTSFNKVLKLTKVKSPSLSGTVALTATVTL